MIELTPAELLQERYRSAADEYPDPDGLAAALEALADQVIRSAGALDDTVEDCLRGSEREHIRSCIYTIAAELRGEPTTTEPQP